MSVAGAGTLLAYASAAVAEICGCFAFWAWLRLGKSPLWLLPGAAALMLFAYLPRTGECQDIFLPRFSCHMKRQPVLPIGLPRPVQLQHIRRARIVLRGGRQGK